MTTLRSRFDAWLASKATEAGARLLTSTVAVGLIRGATGRVEGVRTDRDGGELCAPVVDRLRRGQLVPRQGGRPDGQRRLPPITPSG